MFQKNYYINSLLIESQYFGTITYFNTLFQYTNIKIEQYENYQKMSFRNRCVVMGSNGTVNLSVPLDKGRNQKQLMKDVKISYAGNWQVQHFRTLESCYSRSPFFEFYRDGIWDLLQKQPIFLLDQNMAILEWLQKVLKLTASISLTESYLKEPTNEVVDSRNSILPKNASNLLSPIQYTQVFEDRLGFQPNLSILDMLFCCGPNANTLLKDNKLTF